MKRNPDITFTTYDMLSKQDKDKLERKKTNYQEMFRKLYW
jgi:hypothetical protein